MWIESLNLSLEEKQKLRGILEKNEITEVCYLQRNLYIFLRNSKMVLLKNSDKELFLVLKKKMEKEYSMLEIKRKSSKKKRADEWADSEMFFLKTNFHNSNLNLLSKILKKSQYQISLKAIELGLVEAREWKSSEIKYLKHNIELSNYELAKILNRSISSIKAKKRVLRLEGDGGEIVRFKKI